jgi:hypothetical protein
MEAQFTYIRVMSRRNEMARENAIEETHNDNELIHHRNANMSGP